MAELPCGVWAQLKTTLFLPLEEPEPTVRSVGWCLGNFQGPWPCNSSKTSMSLQTVSPFPRRLCAKAWGPHSESNSEFRKLSEPDSQGAGSGASQRLVVVNEEAFWVGPGEHLPRSCQQPMNRQGLWWRRRSWMLKFTALEKMPRHLRSLSEAQLTDPRRGGWDSALGALWNPLGKWLQAPVLLFPFPDRSHKCSYVMRAEQKPFWKWALPLKVHRNRFWGIPKPFIVLKFCFIRCCWRIRFLLARSYSPFYSGGVLVCNVITGWLFGEEGVRSCGA